MEPIACDGVNFPIGTDTPNKGAVAIDDVDAADGIGGDSGGQGEERKRGGRSIGSETVGPVADNRVNPAGRNATDASVDCIADEDVAGTIDGHSLREIEGGTNSRSAIAGKAAGTGTGNGRNDATGRDPANPKTDRFKDIEVSRIVNSKGFGSSNSSLAGGTAVASGTAPGERGDNPGGERQLPEAVVSGIGN